ncbi:MAG: hypothetical protein WBF53_03320, partial [Litorimonas sp.]
APAPTQTPSPAPAPTVAAAPPADTDEGAGIWGWLKWVLLALLALMALWLLSRCVGGSDTTPTAAPIVDPTPITCWNGTDADREADCPARIECPDGSFSTALDLCPPVEVICPDGSTAATPDACPVLDDPDAATLAVPGDAIPDADARGDVQSASPADPVGTTEPEPTPEPVADVVCWDGSLAFERSECPARPEPVAAPDLATAETSSAEATVLGFFDGPAGLEPKLIRRLGTLPEFGDSHALDPSGFYAKLSDRYDTVDYDRVYLDNLFRAIGYEGGFRDPAVGEALFSNTVMDRGTLGILGFAEYHGVQYVDLDPISDRDLQAFRIEAANGRTVYFMKTSGTYFYPVEL